MKGGAKPKYLNLQTEPKKQVNYKLPIRLIEKIQELSNVTNSTQTEIIETILNNFLDHKIFTNNYLDILESELYIKIPYSYYMKENIKTPKQYLDTKEAYDIEKDYPISNILDMSILYYKEMLDSLSKNEILKIGDLFSIGTQATAKTQNEIIETIKDYAIFLIPNNLDLFNYNTLTYETNFKNGLRGHSGIDFIIIPAIAKYTDDLTNALYIFYFKYIENPIKPSIEVYLIDYIDALDIILNKNDNLKNLLQSIYMELTKANNIDDVKAIAKTYNTNNIIKITDKETAKPNLIKVKENYNDNVNLYSYEALNNKLEALELENKELKEKLNTIKNDVREDFKREAKKLFDDLLKENNIEL